MDTVTEIAVNVPHNMGVSLLYLSGLDPGLYDVLVYRDIITSRDNVTQ